MKSLMVDDSDQHDQIALAATPRARRWHGDRRTGAALASCFGLALLALPATAHAFDWSLKVEPGVAVPLTNPQSHFFGIGGAGTLKALVGLGPYVDVGPTVGFLAGSASDLNLSSDAGIAWQMGGGLRVKRPHDAGRGLGAVSPWLDGDALYVRTGPLNRFGFAVGTGIAFPIGE